ncbi:heterokaryon incompatibility protein-domain-containing protein [Thelonectria olida]|uniref:Heterokaryon incompatibility protein-domain-containing protein n=1 Tax=Thelonectria olida TaxID=1576542 RepID=A0A9P8W4T1_9HYPO|nr:heterokaryon incompatibility protein-domain-containing protein [Thelonectria olida]
MVALQLQESPIPDGEEINDIKKDPRFCRTCYNLHAGSANVTVSIGRIWVHDASGRENVARAKDNSKAPAWAQQARADYTPWRVEAELTDIAQSAAAGCTTCLLLKELLTKLNPAEADFNDPSLRLGFTFCKGNVLRLELDRVEEDDWIPDFWSPAMGEFERLGDYEVYALPGSPSPWPSVGSFVDKAWPGEDALNWKGGPAGHITSDPTSRPLLEKIHGWVKECKESHPICAEAASSIKSRLPKRVLSVGSGDVKDIHLFETDESLQIDEPYIALSHCWGKTHNLLLKKASLAQFKQRIPHDQLSNTFKHAVQLAQGLGIRYVWIDSLCIIQDDKKDWEIEAAKMASIYEGAYLVVAATGFPDGEAGFLSHKPAFITQTGSFPDGKPFELHGRQSIDHAAFSWGYKSPHLEDFINHLSAGRLVDPANYPLFYRAWCFQERMLATRILHFTKDEAIFDCLTCMNCECGALYNHQKDSLVPQRRILRTGQKHIPKMPARRQEVTRHNARWSFSTDNEFVLGHELWRDLVVSYSAKQITRKTDGLPAIAGLAIKLSGDLTGRYLAGLWEKDLVNGLRWYSVEAEADEPNENYTAPSWSWVSVHRGVSWGNDSFEDDTHFIKIDLSRTECPSSGLNPYGEIKYGYIFLTGRIMTLQCSVSSDRGKGSLKKDSPDSESHSFHRDHDDEFQKLGLREVTCLRLSTKARTVNAWDDDCALVLTKPNARLLSRQPEHVQKHEHVFQRVGYLSVYSHKNWHHDRDSKEVGLYLI